MAFVRYNFFNHQTTGIRGHTLVIPYFSQRFGRTNQSPRTSTDDRRLRPPRISATDLHRAGGVFSTQRALSDTFAGRIPLLPALLQVEDVQRMAEDRLGLQPAKACIRLARWPVVFAIDEIGEPPKHVRADDCVPLPRPSA